MNTSFLLTIAFFLLCCDCIICNNWNTAQFLLFSSPSATRRSKLGWKKPLFTPTYLEYVGDSIVVRKGASSAVLQETTIGETLCKSLPLSKRHQDKYRKPPATAKSFYGLVGIYRLPTGLHLLMIRDAELVPFPPPFRLYRATEFQFVRLPSAPSAQYYRLKSLLLSPVAGLEQRKKQSVIQELLLAALKKHQFYFSDTAAFSNFYDVTKSFQDNFLQVNQKNISSSPIAGDNNFFWNSASSESISNRNASGILTTICSGFLSSFEYQINNSTLQYFLFSRRSKTRQGPRYLKRGADENAEVANFVETEQIVEVKGDSSKVSSFRQIRGSIPLLWSQPQTWKLRPPILFDANERGDTEVARRNLDKVWHRYCSNRMQIVSNIAKMKEPDVYLINLIDKKGSQGELGRRWFRALSIAFRKKNLLELHKSTEEDISDRKAVKNLLESHKSTEEDISDRKAVTAVDFDLSKPNSISSAESFARFVWFDYHYQVKNFGIESLQSVHRLLLPALSGSRGGFFVFDNSSFSLTKCKVQKQSKIFRSNCVDCLDRTNVMQTTIGRWVLVQQLQALLGRNSLVSSRSLALSPQELEDKFRLAWADTGDHMSKLYAGSRAMKRDVTRTGKRTRRGMVDDAVSFAQRYVANNYRDGTNQRAIDFLLGVTVNPESLLQDEEDRYEKDYEIDTNYRQTFFDNLLQPDTENNTGLRINNEDRKPTNDLLAFYRESVARKLIQWSQDDRVQTLATIAVSILLFTLH